jgi:hypothetical protein
MASADVLKTDDTLPVSGRVAQSGGIVVNLRVNTTSMGGGVGVIGIAKRRDRARDQPVGRGCALRRGQRPQVPR